MGLVTRKKVIAGLVIIGTAVIVAGVSTIRVRRDFSVSLGGRYFLHRFNDTQILVAPTSWDALTPIIPERVAELDHDDKFVIAKQQQLASRNSGVPNKPNIKSGQPDFSYWILRFNQPQVWGPLTETEFEKQRQSLGVSPSLKLHDIYDYQPD